MKKRRLVKRRQAGRSVPRNKRKAQRGKRPGRPGRAPRNRLRPRIGLWLHRAFEAGRRNSVTLPADTDKAELNESFRQWSRRLLPNPEFKPYWGELSRNYLEGWASGHRIAPPDWVLVPCSSRISVVVTAMNEEQHIGHVLHQVQRLPICELIVVVNGSTDGTLAIAQACPVATVLHYEQALGHDVGRAVGAELCGGDVVLFLDGDLPVKSEQLIPYLNAIEAGADLALNDLGPFISTFAGWDGVSVAKAYLNRVLGREDLHANSMTAVPHAISRRALDLIGPDALMVPPKAQAMLIMHGMRVESPFSIDVIKHNRIRKHNVGLGNPVSRMILGDHLEAMEYVLNATGPRFVYHDTLRKRWMVARKGG